MRDAMKNGVDWNRHHGIGETLLENWVEERAVGGLIKQERSDIAKLSRNGHQVMHVTRSCLPVRN
jgi:hypothetical protein